jgi:lipopolysaccharide exporter
MGLAEKTVKNFGIVLSSLLVLRAIEVGGKVILIRLLTPTDFGMLDVAALYLSMLLLFETGGLDQALIYQKKRTREAAQTSLILMFLIGAGLYAIAYATAPYVAQFFNAPQAASVIRILGLSIILSSISQLPLAIIARELSFGKDAIVSIISVLCNTVTSILFAYFGFGYWSLVYGALAGGVIGAAVAWKFCPWCIGFGFDRKLAFELVRYGKFILLSSIVIYFTTNIDDISVGRILGVTALGFYGISYTVSNLPATNITQLIGKVMFPTYAKLRNSKKRLREAYLKTVRYVSLLSIPTAFGIIAIAHDFVLVVLKPKWAPIIPLVQILALYGLQRSLGATTGEIFKTIGKPQLISGYTSMILVLVALFIIPAATLYGLPGVCWLVVLSGLIPTILALKRTVNLLGASLADLVHSIRAQFTAGGLSLLPALFIRSLVSGTTWTTLAVAFCAYSLSYVLLVYLFDRSLKSEVMILFRMLIR